MMYLKPNNGMNSDLKKLALYQTGYPGLSAIALLPRMVVELFAEIIPIKRTVLHNEAQSMPLYNI